MSHEIRTPINVVLGMNEMILRESESDEVLEYATNIQSAGRTLLTLINSILDFSKIEDGKMEIVPVRYETVALIDDLVNMILDKAQKKGLEFRTEISSKLPRSLYGDDVRIRQVITNILTNAVKYTHAGHVTLKITGAEIDADTFELRVEVSDTGKGITIQISSGALADNQVVRDEIKLIGNRLYSQKDFEAGVRFLEENWQSLRLDRMVTDRLGLSEINRAFEMMLHGENICKIIIDPTK